MSEHEHHWTNDEDLVDRFILGQGSPEERSQLQSHLEVCADCRTKIEAERLFVEQIREVGRKELKERLRSGALVGTRKVPWPHVLSAAAVVVLILGVGLYTVWKEHESVTLTEDDAALPGRREETNPAPGFAEHQNQVERPASAEKRRDQAIQNPDNRKAETGAADAKALQDNLAAQEAPAAAEGMLRGGQREFWLQGRVVTSPLSGKTELDESGAKAAGAPSRQEGRTLGATKEKIAKKDESQGELVMIQQQPLSALPAPMQQKLLRTQTETIPTMVQSTPRGMLLTLYSDRINTKNQNIVTSSPAPDSLIIDIDGTRIVYQIPASLQSSIKKQMPVK